jgi:hypothetical protein
MKTKILSAVCVVVFALLIIYSCTEKKGLLPNPPTPGIPTPPLVKCDTISFAKHVQPFIITDCVDCHYPNNNKGAPNYDYSKWQGLIDAGAVKLKARAITIHDMPKLSPNPDGLTPMKKAILECWIDAGMLNN